MVYAMASALFTYRYKDVGSLIYNSRKRFMNAENGMHQLCTALGKESKALNHFTMERHKPPDYLGDTITGMVLAKLCGADGMEDHCVVITQRWIFDSNFANALLRCMASLDLCCSSDDCECTFMGYLQIAHFPKVKIG